MLDTKDFSFFESQNTFDFKGFLIKTFSYWKWFILSWAIAFTIAYQINIRKEKIYSLETTISVTEENNPLFTSNTSLVFNWGGTSDKVQNIASTLKSRSHNELVVDTLSFYTEYLTQGKYNLIDSYGAVPFEVELDKKRRQIANVPIKIKFLAADRYEVSIVFENNMAPTIRYADNAAQDVTVPVGTFRKVFRVGKKVQLPFLGWRLVLTEEPGYYTGNEYFVRFRPLDGVVGYYQGINVDIDPKAPAILRLSLAGTNKARIVKYLNTTVRVLRDNQLAAKNQFATNTVDFIDEQLRSMEDKLKGTGDELKSFLRNKNIGQIENGGGEINDRLMDMDEKLDAVKRKIAYYNQLRKYLNEKNDFSELPAPSVAGVDDPNIILNVSNLISMSAERARMKYAVKSSKLFQDFDSRMEAVKNVLLENISAAKVGLIVEQNQLVDRMRQAEGQVKSLPEEQQDYLKIQRKYNLNNEIYSGFLQKRAEANIVKAANVSDIKFIDAAKDTGGGLIGPKTGVNYVMALFLGFIIPLLVVFGIFFANNSIQNTEDLAKLTSLPLIGIVGKKHTESNLAVFERPKSALSESFRAIRSSLQFLFRKQDHGGARVLMVTSSVGGEGKTFCSINLATVFAMSEKKTIILGFDLRKPKIFNDFDITNEVGVVDYLSGEKELKDVIQQTHVPHLDVITSGAVPPNPAELIMSDRMFRLMEELKADYDYIILDTPPVGLVSDALELAHFADVTLYIVRQNFTKKDMITLLNNRYSREELRNVSIVLNGFEVKARYGYGYGYNYGYGYGYGTYSNGYLEKEPNTSWLGRVKKMAGGLKRNR